METKKKIYTMLAIVILVPIFWVGVHIGIEKSKWGNPVSIEDYEAYRGWAWRHTNDETYKPFTPIREHFKIAEEKIKVLEVEKALQERNLTSLLHYRKEGRLKGENKVRMNQILLDAYKQMYETSKNTTKANGLTLQGAFSVRNYWSFVSENLDTKADILVDLHNFKNLYDFLDASHVEHELPAYQTQLINELYYHWSNYYEGIPMQFENVYTRTGDPLQTALQWKKEFDRPILEVRPVLLKTNKKVVLKIERVEKPIEVDYFSVKFEYCLRVPGKTELWNQFTVEPDPNQKIIITESDRRKNTLYLTNEEMFLKKAYSEIMRRAFSIFSDHAPRSLGFYYEG